MPGEFRINAILYFLGSSPTFYLSRFSDLRRFTLRVDIAFKRRKCHKMDFNAHSLLHTKEFTLVLKR